MRIDLPDDALDALADRIAERLATRVGHRSDSPKGETWLTTPEAAAHLRLSVDGLHRRAAAGTVPCVREGGRLLFSRNRLDEWLLENENYSA